MLERRKGGSRKGCRGAKDRRGENGAKYNVR